MANPFYTLSARSLEELVQQLNIALSSISDRLDAIEGKRGASAIDSDVSVKGQVLVKDSTGAVLGGFVTTTSGL